MRFDVITLFPELFGPHLTQGITRRAFESGQVDVRLWPLRDFADDTYRRVDDRPYGGGPGMVMLAQPLQRALAAVRAQRMAVASVPASPPAAAQAPGGLPVLSALPVLHFSPAGRPLTQALVRDLAAGPGAVLLCGRYEGIDQRLIDTEVTLELSLGDFVLSGGELPALALLDAVARLQPGVLTEASHQQDSFSDDGLLDCPLQPARAAGHAGRCAAGATGAAERPPRADCALASRRIAASDRASPARPDRRRACRRPPVSRRREAAAWAGQRSRAIIKGFSILCRANV